MTLPFNLNYHAFHWALDLRFMCDNSSYLSRLLFSFSPKMVVTLFFISLSFIYTHTQTSTSLMSRRARWLIRTPRQERKADNNYLRSEANTQLNWSAFIVIINELARWFRGLHLRVHFEALVQVTRGGKGAHNPHNPLTDRCKRWFLLWLLNGFSFSSSLRLTSLIDRFTWLGIYLAPSIHSAEKCN